MATLKGGGKNGKQGEPSKRPIVEVTRDIFGDQSQDELALDFGEVNPKALHSVISRVCHVGGYIGFSAPAGGAAVKLRCSIGDSAGERWVRSGVELSAFLLTVHKFLEAGESGPVPSAEDK